MSAYWKQLLKFVDRSGEKIFFYEQGELYVIMPSEEYEKLAARGRGLHPAGRTKQSIHTVNKEIALWNEAQKEKQNQDIHAESAYARADEKTEEEEDEGFHIEPVDL